MVSEDRSAKESKPQTGASDENERPKSAVAPSTSNAEDAANTNAEKDSVAATLNSNKTSVEDVTIKQETYVHPQVLPAIGDGIGSSSQSQAQQSDIVDVESERFVVCIHDGNEENSAAFRVSPDQTVLRVLKGACKHFKVEFSQSALYMVMSLDDVQKRVKCQNSATMKSLDVQEFQEFVVAAA